jgi:tetrapyrrole methylase family protein / MazG family protein
MTVDFAGLAPVLARLGDRLTDSVQIVDAARLAVQYYPQVDTDQPLLISGVAGRDTAEDVARVLLVAYRPEHEVTVVAGDSLLLVTLAGLATATGWGENVWVLVPPLPHPGSYLALQEVVARLRAPDGCPWDRELTWDKLRAFLLEESYELLTALDTENPQKVAEEQGDLFLQLALQTQIAVEEGKYRAGDVMSGIVSKLIRRHPHVFGDEQVSGTDEVLANWEAIKRAERAANGEKRSPLSGIPAGLPALAQAEAYLDRISRLTTIDVPAIPCTELLGESDNGLVSADTVGRALLGLVAWARARGIDAESALRATNASYAERISEQS